VGGGGGDGRVAGRGGTVERPGQARFVYYRRGPDFDAQRVKAVRGGGGARGEMAITRIFSFFGRGEGPGLGLVLAPRGGDAGGVRRRGTQCSSRSGTAGPCAEGST